MWPFAHKDRPLQLRVFGSFSPLVPSCNYTFGSQEKKRKKKKSRTSCAPFAPGTHPCRAQRCLFQPIIPPTATRRPRFLRSYEIFTCSEPINSSRRLSSHQPRHRNSLREEGGLEAFSGRAGDSFRALHSSWALGRDVADQKPETRVQGRSSALCSLLWFLQRQPHNASPKVVS